MKTRTKAILLAAAAVLVGLRAALPVIVKSKINDKLARLENWDAAVSDVDLKLLRGGILVKGINAASKHSPMRASVAHVAVNISWSALLRRRMVASVDVLRPRAALTLKRAEKKEVKKAAVKAEKKVEAWPPVDQMLPFRVDSFKVRDGEVEVTEGGAKAELKEVYFAARGLTNIGENARARGEAGASFPKGGTAKVDFHLVPESKPPAFGVAVAVKQVDLAALNPLLLAQFGMDVEKGKFELVAEATSAAGGFTGYVKPFVDDLKMGPTGGKDKGPAKVIKEAVVGAVASALKNRKTEAVAAKVPFEGKYDNPDIGVWQALVSVLRNAFVKALTPTFEKG